MTGISMNGQTKMLMYSGLQRIVKEQKNLSSGAYNRLLSRYLRIAERYSRPSELIENLS